MEPSSRRAVSVVLMNMHTPKTASMTMSPTILRPGRNAWRIERAHRAAVIVDAAAYFAAVRAALIKAERHAFIIGWDMHSLTRLVGPSGRADDGYPETFAEFLTALAREKPDLRISLLLWDFVLFYAPEREMFPAYSLRWNTPANIRFCLDDAVPLGSSQHQKLIVVDDSIAFSGGLDVTTRRWDTSDHRADNPLRVDPDGKSYEPFHDVQMLIDGPAARALARLARARWECAAHEQPVLTDGYGDPWPDEFKPDFTDVDVAISRTQPCFEEQKEVREVEALFIDSIAAAERSIYIENQFLSCNAIAQALAKRMRETPTLEVLMVSPGKHHSWIEARTMRNGRIRFMQVLQEAGVAGRARLVSPVVRDGNKVAHTMVHSKIMVVDDRFLRVGSANVNNRSMGTDTECDIAIEAASDAERAAIVCVRNRLIGDHCGVTENEVAAALSADSSLLTLPKRLGGGGHTLAPIDDGAPDSAEWTAYLQTLADPEKPIGIEDFASGVIGGPPSRASFGTLAKVGLAGLAVLALALAWYLSPLADLADPDRVRGALQQFAAGAWGPVVVLIAFIGGTLLLFPVTILIAATAAAFGPWLGFAYSVLGTLMAALIAFGLGALVGREALSNVMGPRLNRIRQKVRRKGVLAVALIRLVPLAPFGVVNLAAGASRIRLIDFMLGTAVGMLPGIAAMAVLGHQITQLVTEPTFMSFVWLALAVLAWIALSLGIQATVSKWSDKD